MNTTCGFKEGNLEKELEFARARVALLESKLRSASCATHNSSENKYYWSQIDHYIRLVDNIDQGIVGLDEYNKTIFVNQSTLSLLECCRSNFEFLDFFESVSEAAHVQIVRLLNEIKKTKFTERCEFALILPSDINVVLRLKFIPIFGVSGCYEGVQIMVTDVTDERNVKLALEHSEKIYQALFDGAGDAIFVQDDGGCFIDANKVACERLGYSRDELLKMTAEDVRREWNWNESEVFLKRCDADNSITQVKHSAKNGNRVVAEVNTRTVDFNGEKKTIIIARDITDRIESEKREVFNRNRLRALYEMAHMNETSISKFFEFALIKGLEITQSEIGFITLLDGSGNDAVFCNWISVNKTCANEIIPKPKKLADCGIWREAIVQRVPIVRNTGLESLSMHPFSDGGARNYIALPILEAGKVVAIAVLVNKDHGYDDVSLRNISLLFDGMWNIACKKQSEEKIRQSLKEKETLLKEVHHRVKNNMQVICSLLNLQKDYVKDPQDLILIKHSIDRVRSMAYVHEQLYRSDDLSSIDFGHYISNLGFSLVSSYGVGEKIDFSTSLDSINLPIQLALPCGLIVNELITNAIAHAFPDDFDRGTKKLSVKLILDDDIVSMLVSDNGIGIEKGLERSGSLGHILVDTLVQQIDGEMEYYSDEGANFNLTFRLK